MNIIEKITKVAVIAVSCGVSAIVSNAIKSTTPSSISRINKICIGIGGMVLSGMFADMAARYTEQKIVESVTEIKTMIKNDEI